MRGHMSEPLVIDNDTQQPVADGPDWDAIERVYRTNTLSNRELGSAYGVSETAIRKRAKRDGWTRDLEQRVRERSEEMVRQQEVRDALVGRSGSQDAAAPAPPDEREAEDVVVEIGAAAMATIKLTHRRGAARFRALADRLLDELEQSLGTQDALREVAEVLASVQETTPEKLMEVMQRVVSLPGRVDTAKKLAEVLKIVYALEREAWGMDKVVEAPPQSSIGGWLQGVQRPALQVVKEVPRDE